MTNTTYWTKRAESAILAVHNAMPLDAPLADRKKAVDAAYPFGERKYHPYKIWLKVRRDYLKKFGHRPRVKGPEESPLERLMREGPE